MKKVSVSYQVDVDSNLNDAIQKLHEDLDFELGIRDLIKEDYNRVVERHKPKNGKCLIKLVGVHKEAIV